MYFVTTLPTTTARHIARSAQQQIKQKTGMSVHLMTPMGDMSKTPQRMLHVIALALDMNPEDYRNKTRVRSIVEMRFLSALLLRQNYPTLTLCQIARLFGGQDHTSIISGLNRAYTLIAAGDVDFTRKYNIALKSVNKWLRREE